MKLIEPLVGKRIVIRNYRKVSFYKDADGNDIVFDGRVFELML